MTARSVTGRGFTARLPAAVAALAWVTWSACAVGLAGAAAEPGEGLRGFLATKGIDATARAPLAAGGAWSGDKEALLVRVLARLPAPDTLVAAWHREAEPLTAHGLAVDDRLVVVEGRATRVAPLRLSAESAALAGRGTVDVVRFVDSAGVVVDAVVPRAPLPWRRWAAIDEPATVVGLPLAAGGGPAPHDAAAADRTWPVAPPDFLVAATAVEWHPAGLLGGLGMDFTLFDGVIDDRKLEAADAAAFWAALAAVRTVAPAEIARVAGGATDIVALIDPGRDWFASHRGDPVVIDGVARRATRIAIDDPLRRGQVAADHYWEVEVFVDTPLLSVDGNVQDRYPVVCCVRELAPGMPTGETISERVRVPGFAFKRYRYPLAEVVVDGVRELPAGGSRSVPLVVAPRAEWIRAAPPQTLSDGLFGVFAAMLATVAALLAASTWWIARDTRRRARQRRESLPDRIDLPAE